jgi:hypothetical protein
VFHIEVNHVKSGFFFASKRNEIFASISNFASEAKVRAHPTYSNNLSTIYIYVGSSRIGVLFVGLPVHRFYCAHRNNNKTISQNYGHKAYCPDSFIRSGQPIIGGVGLPNDNLPITKKTLLLLIIFLWRLHSILTIKKVPA